jgi:hypothetical protein
MKSFSQWTKEEVETEFHLKKELKKNKGLLLIFIKNLIAPLWNATCRLSMKIAFFCCVMYIICRGKSVCLPLRFSLSTRVCDSS